MLAPLSPAGPNRTWPVHSMSPSGKYGSLSGGAASANPRSPSCAATRFAWPRWPPALSTRTLTEAGGIGATPFSAPAGSDLRRAPDRRPASGRSGPGPGPDALTSTAVQVTSAAAASTVTTAITGPRRRRW